MFYVLMLKAETLLLKETVLLRNKIILCKRKGGDVSRRQGLGKMSISNQF